MCGPAEEADMPTLDRRQTLALITGGTLGACAAPQTQAVLATHSPVFAHGVASGDPRTTSVVLWTRVTTDAAEQVVTWHLARDADFSDLVQSGKAVASAEADYTVKVIPEGLEPGAQYYYRFDTAGGPSPTGRTRTLPVGSLDRLGIALISCSNYPFGYFNAYDAIAGDADVEFVLHTGDYIYEYGADSWGTEAGTGLGRLHAPAHEIVTLADYRTRHAQYKTDAGSRAMHGAHAFIASWDDHESANNPWTNGAQNHQSDTEGDWTVRRNASLRAYYEWMPIREPEPGFSRAEFWRTYSFGDLATLVTLETRHTGRGQQVDYSVYGDTIASPETRDLFMRDVIDDPDRKMLSPRMETALADGLSASVAAGQPWRLIGNPSPIARMRVPDVAAYGIDPAKAPKGEAPGEGTNLFWKAKWHLPLYTDTWDGYPAAREALYALSRAAGAEDLLFLTGDSHSFWANQLFDGEGRPMGLELGTAGVTSPGDFVDTGWDAETAKALDRVFEQALDEVRWTDNMHQGYVRVVLRPAQADVTYVAVDTVLLPTYRTEVIHTETVVKDGKTLRFA
jgi:alkaline phosphatase D